MRALLCLLALAAPAFAAEPFVWPNGARYAVALTYDDSLQSHLNVAIPQLNAAGLKGTFFLTGKPLEQKPLADGFAGAAKAGHELANHSLTHPCPAAIKLATKLEDYDLAKMAAELDETQRRVKKLAGKNTRHPSYAYPCGATWVGADRVSYKPLAVRRFVGARGVMGVMNDPWSCDLYDVPAVDGARPFGALRSWVDDSEAAGAWLVFVFHGVGGDYLSVSAEAHQALVDYLKSAGSLVWVAPFGEQAAWVKKQRGKKK